jgi:hypothetical protein
MSSGIIPGGYGLYVNGFGYVGFGAGSYSEPLYTTSWNVNADPTNWHHIAISISPTKRRFFLDGVLVVSADFSGSLELAANATSQFGQLIIDELRITNKALWQDTDDFSANLPHAPYDLADDVYEINATGQFRKLVEVYSNGTSWYKVFDEYDPTTGNFIGKWCEQGGSTVFTNYSTTVSLLKTYADTNYTLITATYGWSNTPSQWIAGGVKSTNQFTIVSTTSLAMTAAWRTEGYLAIQ